MSRVAKDQNDTMMGFANKGMELGREMRQQMFDEDIKRGTYGREGAQLTRDERAELALQDRQDNKDNFDQTRLGRDQDWKEMGDQFDMDYKRRNLDRSELNDQFRQQNDLRADYRQEADTMFDQDSRFGDREYDRYSDWYDKPMDRAKAFSQFARGPNDPGSAQFQPSNISGDYWGETQSRRSDATQRYGIDKRGSGDGGTSFEDEMAILDAQDAAASEVAAGGENYAPDYGGDAMEGAGAGLQQGIQQGRKTAMGKVS
jgi:hypothetical protein